MNYGKRTTNTTTHRDTPLSSTPEPKITMFKDLPEVTVRANAKPLSLKTVSPAQSGKELTWRKRMYESSIPRGMEVPKKKKKSKFGESAALGTWLAAGLAGSLINDYIETRNIKKSHEK
jgi:predicted butyrate kinase (DUF1464 family)